MLWTNDTTFRWYECEHNSNNDNGKQPYQTESNQTKLMECINRGGMNAALRLEIIEPSHVSLLAKLRSNWLYFHIFTLRAHRIRCGFLRLIVMCTLCHRLLCVQMCSFSSLSLPPSLSCAVNAYQKMVKTIELCVFVSCSILHKRWKWEKSIYFHHITSI